MENSFKVEVVSPEEIIFSSENIQEVVLPSYEGEIGILKEHIPIIAFLKPGIIKFFKSSENIKSFFIQSGIIEFYNNNLTILSSDIIDLKNLKKEKIDHLILEAEKVLNNKQLKDDKAYLASHQISVLKFLSLN